MHPTPNPLQQYGIDPLILLLQEHIGLLQLLNIVA